MVFGRLYATPDGLDDLWMESDGEALVGLRFVSPAEAARPPWRGLLVFRWV